MTPTDPLNIAIISLDIAYSDKEANLGAASRAIRSLSGVHLAILPELFSTGFLSDTEATRSLAEPLSGPTITAIRELSAATQIAICGSFICCDDHNGNIYNRCFFITPTGELYHYDKHHLFILGEEANIYTPGSELPPIIPYLGWNLSMACCYDLRFPCWLRNRVAHGALSYDVMLIPANWPDVRAYAWHHLLIARGIENQAYYVGANRSGEDAYGTYQDLAEIVDYEGRPLSAAVESMLHGGMVLTASLSRSRLAIRRKAFPAWKSAD